MGMRVRHKFGGITYQVQPFCDCIGLYAICEDEFGQYTCTVPDYIYTNVANMLADDFMEVA